MRVIKRDGREESIHFDKILLRIQSLARGRNISTDPTLSRELQHVKVHEICQMIISRIYDGVSTSQIDELAANICSSLIAEHPDYGTLAARIIASNHHKNTSPSFSETIQMMYDNGGCGIPLVSDKLYATVMANKEKLNAYIDYSRDYLFDTFGWRTLQKAYLTRVNGRCVERPQHMWMRVALGIHGDNIKDAIVTYDMMSLKYATHATPTLFNAGTPTPQQSSCFLLAMKDDSVAGMYSSVSDCAMISKYAGGIGIHVHNIRAKGSVIRGTNGISNGLIPLLRVLNATARHIDQAGRRPGSIAVYLEPWHADIEAFLEAKKNHGAEEERARDLFYALWIPDLFMERVQAGGEWSLMCPDECRGLADVFGDEFRTLYERYEAEGRFRKRVKAQDLWMRILTLQVEQGVPYMLYKDAVNRKNNQANLGTIKSSNLCTEICEYSDRDSTAVCNLSSICLPTFVKDGKFMFDRLHEIAKILTNNLNLIIDTNLYPIIEAANSNFKHRPIGLGVQGLADVFALLKLPFESEEARALNRDIFETIYHAALEASMEIARRRYEWFMELSAELETFTGHGYIDWVRYFAASDKSTFEGTWNEAGFNSVCELSGAMRRLNLHECELDACRRVVAAGHPTWIGAYSSFAGSPASEGRLQFDLWGYEPGSRLYDWAALKAQIAQYGLRNSLLVAPMPTASTSQILGANECFEPFTSNLYKRKTMAGEFIVINKYLVADLMELGLWNTEMKEAIMIGEGSIQHITSIPADIRERYKTVWEIKQKTIIDMAADRGVFVCQSQSMNLFVEDPEFKKLTAMHFHAWKRGLKTGMYYLRTKPKASTQQFTIDPRKAKSNLSAALTSIEAAAITNVSAALTSIEAAAVTNVAAASPAKAKPTAAVPAAAAAATGAGADDKARLGVGNADDDEEETTAVGCNWKPGCKSCSS